MKKPIKIQRLIVALAAVSSVVCGGTFMLLYAGRLLDEGGTAGGDAAGKAPYVITPHHFGSYGELMFAYVGEHNYLYDLDDESQPLIEQPASQLLYASDDTVLYTASAELNADHPGREYLIQELQIGEHENSLFTIAQVSTEPCWSSNDEVIYFVRDELTRRGLPVAAPYSPPASRNALASSPNSSQVKGPSPTQLE